MANKQFASGIDAVGIPLINVRLQNAATAPGTPLGNGHIYFDSALNSIPFWNGTAWIDLRARANHTGTQIAATISDFNAAVRTNRLDQLAAPAANVPMAGFTLTGLPAPSGAGQAAESSWVTSQIQSAAAGIASKPPVRLVATTNQTLTGLTAIDGVTPNAGDRILLVGQTTASANGVYNAASGTWTRTTVDGSGAGEIEPGAMWLATEGTANAGTQWRVSTIGAITVGTTNLSIVQFGAGQTYTAGNGLTLAGNAFSVNPLAGGGVLVSSSGVSVDPTVFMRRFTATIGDGTTASIAVTHGLGTKNIIPGVRAAATDTFVDVDCVATSTTVATFNFATAPAASAYIATIIG